MFNTSLPGSDHQTMATVWYYTSVTSSRYMERLKAVWQGMAMRRVTRSNLPFAVDVMPRYGSGERDK